jgi:uncharacterized iron-regulated protein
MQNSRESAGLPHSRVRALLWLSASILAAQGCASSALLQPAGGFTHALGRDHPLVGRVYAVEERVWAQPEGLFDALAEADFALLGEAHGNRDHHLLQAQLLQEFASAHPAARVAFEMLDESQAAPLAAAAGSTADALAERVGWSETGWPAFELYRPVFEAALSAGLSIVAAHPSREHVRASMQGIDAAESAALRLDEPLAAEQTAAQREEIRESHCGHAPDAMVVAMQRAQAYKDAFMARALVQAGPPALLIAGRGHVRKDRGVPLFSQRLGARNVLSVAFVEVADQLTQPGDYDVQAFDYVVFTPRESDEDACARFKEQLERLSPSASSSTSSAASKLSIVCSSSIHTAASGT